MIPLIEKGAIIKLKHLKKQKEVQTSENNTVFSNKYKLLQAFCSLTIKKCKMFRQYDPQISLPKTKLKKEEYMSL